MGSVYQRMLKRNIRTFGLVNNYENDWKKFAESLGAYGVRVCTADELIFETEKALIRTGVPTVIDVKIKFPSYIPDTELSKSAYA